MKLFFAPYSREFKEPFFYGDKSISRREGICLRFESAAGTLYSEASPLPGHSRDSIEEVVAVLKKLTHEYCAAIVADEDDTADHFPPSLAFGIEALRAQRKLAELGGKPLRTNALVPWLGIKKSLELIWEKKAAGFATIKLKLMDNNAGEMLELLSSVEGKGIQIRLDANRSLQEGTLRTFFQGLEKFSPVLIDYLEEPFAHWRHPMLEKSPVALAADECAADPRFWRAILGQKTGPTVFVLKPTVSGGLFSLAEKAVELKEAGKRIVFSSALECEPGRRGLLSYLSLTGNLPPAGVSTGFLFRENFLEDRAHWEEIPGPNDSELRWLNGLAWEPLPR